jgi:hypothetical protein
LAPANANLSVHRIPSGLAHLAGSKFNHGVIMSHEESVRIAANVDSSEAGQSAQKVTIDTFARAETHTYFRGRTREAGGTGRMMHNRMPADIKHQAVVRMNRDTLYSSGIFDLSSPVTVTLPDAGNRFMSMMVVNEDHYIKYVTYEPGIHEITQRSMGTRYVAVIIRIFVDPSSNQDKETVNTLQDQIVAAQESPGSLDLPAWDKQSLDGCRTALQNLGLYVPDALHAFGNDNEVDPVRHLIGTARGWGGNRTEDAHYMFGYVEKNDGLTPYIMQLNDVPVDGFWSISVYNASGFFEPNDYDAYSLNGTTAKPDADGKFTIRFGGDPHAENFLYIMPGWNYTLRLYRPRPEAVDGRWVPPKPTLAIPWHD